MVKQAFKAMNLGVPFSTEKSHLKSHWIPYESNMIFKQYYTW
jgi:hypothetical protein